MNHEEPIRLVVGPGTTCSGDKLLSEMRNSGLEYIGPINPDGKLHRIRVTGDKERNSWYVLHPGPPAAGAYGCWKRGLSETWCERQPREMSETQWAAVRKQWQAADAERKRCEKERRDKARTIAARLYERAQAADASNLYLAVKGVRTFGGVRQMRDGRLLLPLRDADGQIHSLQFIDANGTKRFLAGGRIAGCHFVLEDQPDGPLVVCEGYATGASVCEATGLATVAALNCGNLLAVSKALRTKYPQREIIIAADNDVWTKSNPGMVMATEAAKTVRARLAVPEFTDTKTKPTDFNDLHQLEGLNTVKTQIELATVPSPAIKQSVVVDDHPEAGHAPGQQLIELPPKYSPPPLTLLPSNLQEYVCAAADSLDVDVAFIFLPLLSACAAAIGNSRSLRIKKGFVQPAILWTTIVARSGSKKSPALSAIASFVNARERQLLQLNTAARSRFDQCHQEWDAKPKKARGEEPKQPARLTCSLDDLTLSAIAPILQDNPRGALVVKDELASWLGSFGQFSKTSGGTAADLSGWLSLFNGERLFLDRKTNRESIRVFNPRLSIAGCIPPSVLSGALTKDFFQRGLPARIFFAAPPPRVNVWKDTEVPERLEFAVAEVFNRLFALEAEEGEDGPTPKEITIAADGLEVFKDFYNRIGQHAMDVDEKEEAVWSKLIGGAARLALVGHLTQGFDLARVNRQVMQAAVELATWFGFEAERIYASFHEPLEVVLCRRLMEFIRGQGGVVTVRRIAENFRPLKNRLDEIERQLDRIKTSRLGDWLPVEVSAKGGRPTPTFSLFPGTESLSCPGNLGIAEQNGGFQDKDTSSTCNIQPIEAQAPVKHCHPIQKNSDPNDAPWPKAKKHPVLAEEIV